MLLRLYVSHKGLEEMSNWELVLPVIYPVDEICTGTVHLVGLAWTRVRGVGLLGGQGSGCMYD